jgi:outer membrane protein OmpA-like peptidoglycan-associated protein
MLTRVLKGVGKERDQAEKPFWISYADLMTALMALFLVAMTVALLAVTKKFTEQERHKMDHDLAVQQFLAQVSTASASFPDLTVDRQLQVIDFHERALFATDVYKLTAEQAVLLRRFVPKLLAIAQTDLGKGILKRVVVEGFASESGSYLHNLNLSLERSEAVLCALFDSSSADDSRLSTDQLQAVRDLFVVGGYSFNVPRATAAASRRVELRLEFYAADEAQLARPNVPPGNFGSCELR